MSRLYKDRYIMALYHNDRPLGVFDDSHEISKVLGLKLSSVDSALSRAFKGTHKLLRFNGVAYEIHFIDAMKEEE